MIRKIKNAVWLILRKINLGGAVQLMLKSCLLEDGWFESFNKKESINREGKPIPWNTYPFIKFIELRLKPHFLVFEFGSGNSTIWYSQRVKFITAVENDSKWFEIIKNQVPKNASVVFKKLEYEGEYCREVLNQKDQFHIIIIDGRDRVNAVKTSIEKLRDDGIIIFDNSELSQYNEGIEYLIKFGFKRLDFFGMAPITAHQTTTSVFYRSNNCLGI